MFHESIRMDITNLEEAKHVITEAKPDMVVHAAAETDVDKCESSRTEAWRVNVEGTRHIAEACNAIGAKMIFISTDYVFDGEKGSYTEEDAVNPISYYGLTKLAGEELVKENCRDYVIVRASVLYGWHPWKLNFATWVIGSLKRGRQISVVEDHYSSPTLSDNLGEAILKIVEKSIRGIYHTAGSERISKYEFALKIAEVFELDKTLIKPIKMRDLKVWIARRPRDSSLCVDKARRELEVKLLNVVEGLREMKEASL
jgi:dTDP-4-dehydrorhamnose reductase